MIPFSRDGFEGAGVVMIFWGFSELEPKSMQHPWLLIGAGLALMLIGLLWPTFFRQFDRKEKQ